MEPQRRTGAIVRGVIALVVIVALTVASFLVIPAFGDPERIAELVEEAGVWGPLVFVVLQALQVIAAPVPGHVTGLASGFLFGTLMGTIYSTIGGTIGCAIVFVLARKLGRPFVEAVVSQKAIQRFDYFSRSGGALVLLIIFLVPVFPDDIISYIAGLSRIPIYRLVLVALAGRLPGYILFAIAGERAAAADMTILIFIGVGTAVLLGLFYWQRQRIEGFVKRLARNRSAEEDERPASG